MRKGRIKRRTFSKVKEAKRISGRNNRSREGKGEKLFLEESGRGDDLGDFPRGRPSSLGKGKGALSTVPHEIIQGRRSLPSTYYIRGES